MTELKPCPFCGGEATVERIGHNGYYFVACTGFNCCDSALADTEAEAIEAWNTRAERTCKMESVWGTNALQCSECYSYVSTWDVECDIGKINYCPNCGAKVV